MEERADDQRRRWRSSRRPSATTREGYWREGDLWSDFDARAREHADRVALVLDDRRVTYAELRRAAIAVSHRLADAAIEPGDVVILLGRHSIEAAVAMLGCLHRGVVLAPLPPMFSQTQMSALVDQTRATAIVSFGGEKEIAKCREVAGDRLPLLTVLPEDVDARDRPGAPGRARARHADDLALVLHSSGTTSAPKGIAHSSNTLRYATEGVCYALGPDRRGHLPDRGRVRLRRRAGLRLPARAAPGRDRCPAQPLGPEEALRLIEAHRCTYVLACRRTRPT